MRVKICGITIPEQGVAIAREGATALGFICVPASPRYVTKEQIRTIIQTVTKAIPSGIDRIGVFANTTVENICQIFADTGLSGVQLHGDESPEFCLELRSCLPPEAEIIKALRVKNAATLSDWEAYKDVADTLLLDAYHPERLGGTGQQLDSAMLRDFQPSIPWLLAGGLNPDNVLDAIERSRCPGIDLSSGVERSPGDKDLAKVAQLFAKLRAIDE